MLYCGDINVICNTKKTMSKLKYEIEINRDFENFDFKGFIEKNIECYRWVFNDINNPKNFIPPYISDVNRSRDIPTGYALSFFETKEAGSSRLKFITKNKPFLKKKLGTHIALGNIKKTDGLCNEPNDIKHFDLFEYSGINLIPNFTILEEII